jgi:hypothetical protein
MAEENKNNKNLGYIVTKEEVESGIVSEEFKYSFLKSHAKNVGADIEAYIRWRAESLMRAREKIRGSAQISYNPQ